MVTLSLIDTASWVVIILIVGMVLGMLSGIDLTEN